MENAVNELSKEIFVQLKIDFEDLDNRVLCEDGAVKRILIHSDMTYKDIKKMLYHEFGIEDTSLVLKLRNTRGCMIPLGRTIEPHPKPYTLEVCQRYQHVSPLKRTASLTTYEGVLRRKVQRINGRLTKLEDFLPGFPQKQILRAQEEYADLLEKMAVLERKLTDADTVQWQGMFKKNPLW